MNSKLLVKALISAVVFFSLSSYITGNAETGKTITVAGITDKVPVEYNAGKTGYAGVYVELWKTWSKKTGIPVNYIIMTPDAAEKALENNEVDVIMGYSRSDKVKKFAVSGDIYLSACYIYHTDNISSAENLTELIPHKVGIISSEAEVLRRIKPDIFFIVKDSVPELIDASERGEINIFIADAALANHQLRKLGLWRKFVQSSEPVLRHGIAAAVRADDGHLLQLVNSGFSSINDIERLVIERTWYGGNFRYRMPWVYIATVLIIISVIAGVSVIWWWNFQLQKKIDNATRELIIMKEAAEEASVAKSRFLDNISHELRTPLTLILAPVEDALSGKVLENSTLEMIQRNSRNLLSLINDLLDVSRITAGKMTLEVVETDLCAAVKLYCAEMESAAEHRGIELSFSLPDEPVMAFIDTKKFSRIISNLFSNSFKFTGRGGKINLSLVKESGNIILKFSDTGSGILSSKVGDIFNLFSQADTSLNNYGGTGIGLAIVKEIAELHGGSVTVQSRHASDYPENHGTELYVSIPAGIEHLTVRGDVEFTTPVKNEFRLPYARIIHAVKSGNVSGGITEKKDDIQDDLPSILIVEDNTDMLNFLERLLSEDYTIFTASNGVKALEVLGMNDSIDLILSDVMMPEMDGNELMRQIRADEKFEGMPVIFLTAREDDFIKHKGLGLGAVDYLTKPFNTEELKLRIRNQIELRIMRNNLQRKNEELYARLKQRIESRKTPVSGDIKMKLESVCEFIKEHSADNLNRDNIATAIDMNPDTFSRMFNQHTGRTLPDYINEMRVNAAKVRLAGTDDPVTRICMDTGFDSIRTFNRSFKKITGQTPGDYRAGLINN